jgi:hypothetical protein
VVGANAAPDTDATPPRTGPGTTSTGPEPFAAPLGAAKLAVDPNGVLNLSVRVDL